MTEYTRKRRPGRSGRSIPATEAAKNFGRLVNRVRETQAVYVVERGGVPVAQIAPVPSMSCTVADLVDALRGRAGLPREYVRAVEAAVKTANKPVVPRDPWAR